MQNPHRSRVVALPFQIDKVPTEFLGSENPLGDRIKVGSGCLASEGRSLGDETGDDLPSHGDCHMLPLLDSTHDGWEVLTNISNACGFHCFTEMFHRKREYQEGSGFRMGAISPKCASGSLENQYPSSDMEILIQLKRSFTFSGKILSEVYFLAVQQFVWKLPISPNHS